MGRVSVRIRPVRLLMPEPSPTFSIRTSSNHCQVAKKRDMQMIVQVGKHQVRLKSLDDWAYYFYLAHRCQVARDADGTSVLHLLSSFAHGFSRWQEGVGRRLEFFCNYQKVDKMMKQVGKNTQLIEAFKAC